MREYLRVARLYLVLLAIVAVGRWVMGVRHVPYEQGHHVFSVVTLTLIGAILYGAFTRRWLGFPVSRAAALGATMAVCAQAVILLATILSYALGMETYFNNPRAVIGATEPGVTIGFGQAVLSRLFGAVVNVVLTSIAAALGWFMGRALPDPTGTAPGGAPSVGA